MPTESAPMGDPLKKRLRLSHYDYSQPGGYFVTICTQDRRCLLGRVVNDEMQLNDLGKIVQAEWENLPQRFPGIEMNQFVVMPNHVHGIIVLGDQGNPPLRGVDARFIARFTIGAINRAATGVEAPAPSVSRPLDCSVGARFIAPVDSTNADSPIALPPDTGETGAMNRAPTGSGAPTGSSAPTLGQVIRAFKAVSCHLIRRAGHSSFEWQRNYYEHIIRGAHDLQRIREYIFLNPTGWEKDPENPAVSGKKG